MSEKKELVIWGAGRWGKAAYAYYSDYNSIMGFIDSDKSIWGTAVLGLPVFSPDILSQRKYNVIIAMKYHVDEVKRTLLNKYGIDRALIFSVQEIFEDIYEESEPSSIDDEIIVTFCSGLGNQMFQYALYRIYEKQGKKARADLSKFIISKSSDSHDLFSLSTVFPNVDIIKYSPNIKKYFYENSCIFAEPIRPKKVFDEKFIRLNHGIVSGYFQSYHYPEMVKEELKKAFMFDNNAEPMLKKIIQSVKSESSVGVHFRRGDYLDRTVYDKFGNPCDETYYKNAMELVKEKLNNPRFVFFSNDIEWVKNNYEEENAIYIESTMFKKYEDWYDMCIMSHCAHNIIANSTFSWWAAWLNQNPSKIVIAPEHWMRYEVMQDICPPEWIRI